MVVMKDRRQNREVLLALLITLMAIAIRVYGNWWDYPHAYHPDEWHSVERAVHFITERSIRTDFFIYPTAYMYILSVVYGIVGGISKIAGVLAGYGGTLAGYYEAMPADFYIIGRTVTALLGGATVWVTWLIGRALFSARLGLVAALFLAFAYSHCVHSHYATTDVPATFFAMLSFYFSVRIFQGTGSRSTYVYAGLLAGLGAATKYPAALALAPLVVAHLLRASADQEATEGRSNRYLWPGIASALVGFGIGCPSAFFESGAFVTAFVDMRVHSQTGHLGIQPGTLWGYFTQLTPAGGVGLALAIAAGFGMMFGLWSHRRRTLLLLSFPALYYAIIGPYCLQYLRYFVPNIPFLCIFAALFVEQLHVQCFERRRLRVAAPIIAVILVATPAYYCVLRHHIALLQEDTRDIAGDWALAHIPRSDKILVCFHSRIPLPPDSTCRMEETYTDMLHGRYKVFLRSWRTVSRLPCLPAAYRRQAQANIGVYEELVKQTPAMAQSRARPLEYYYRQGCRWAIVESNYRARFYKPWTEKQYPAMAQSWQEFYAALEEDAEVVFRVSRHVRDHPWGLGFDQAPDITIYRLDAQMADAGPP